MRPLYNVHQLSGAHSVRAAASRPLHRKNTLHTTVTWRVYTIALGGSCGSVMRARRSTIGGPYLRLKPNSANMNALTRLGYQRSNCGLSNQANSRQNTITATAIQRLPGRRAPVSARSNHRLPSSRPNCHGAKCSVP
ncbi:hypothetical protein [Pseudomonas sp. 22 E 5]|nr:hypothetical protein [Pseudomonas sp. 22 E 5]